MNESTYINSRIEGRGIAALGDIGSHDLLEEISVDIGHFLPTHYIPYPNLLQTIILILILSGKISRGLMNMISIKNTITVRDKDTLFILGNLQIPTSLIHNRIPYQES